MAALWSQAEKSYNKKIQTLQNKMLRRFTGCLLLHTIGRSTHNLQIKTQDDKAVKLFKNHYPDPQRKSNRTCFASSRNRKKSGCSLI